MTDSPTLLPGGMTLEGKPDTRRPVDLRDFLPKSLEKDLKKLRRLLPCGVHWQILDALAGAMLADPDESGLVEDLEELRRNTSLSAEEFAAAYPKVRSVAFKRENGRIYCRAVKRAHAFANERAERMSAVWLLGGYMNGLLWAIRRLKGIGAESAKLLEELERAAKLLRKVLTQRQWLHAKGGREVEAERVVAIRRQLKGQLMSLAAAGELARSRLLGVAEMLKMNARAIDRFWRSNPAWARDLAIRERLGVLGFSTLFRLLTGRPVTRCDWPPEFEAAELPSGLVQAL